MHIHDFDLRDYLLILDCNALMHEQPFIKNDLVLAIKEYRNATGNDYFIFIPKTVKEELESLSQRPNSSNIGKRTDAIKAIATMEELVVKGYGKIAKTDFTGAANGFNDVAMLTMLMELRRHSDIAVLSNDRNFCTDLLSLNLLKSVNSKKQIRAFYVGNRTGRMAEWKLDPEHREAVRFPNELSRRMNP